MAQDLEIRRARPEELQACADLYLKVLVDTFTWLHPHYTVDDDYEQRKGRYDGVRDWGVGQASAAINALDILLDAQAGWHGIFPELVLFDCHACHRPMSGKAWGPRQGTGLGAMLLRDAIDRCRSLGASVLWCNARDSAARFYERLGFVQEGDGFITTTTQLPHHVMVLDL